MENKWPYSKELENWCHFQFKVKQELQHTQGFFYRGNRMFARHDFPWLEAVSSVVDGGNRTLFLIGFFAN